MSSSCRCACPISWQSGCSLPASHAQTALHLSSRPSPQLPACMLMHLDSSPSADKLDKDEHPRWVAYLFEVDWDVCLQVIHRALSMRGLEAARHKACQL